ncbi:MAG: YkgJ family cysteine cluster protein [Candidatus Bathyarchaeota archaeon]|nr:YkgJ family cysteine cluster protein [Candidatus Bathyarchaeota archaeon]
MADKTAKSYTSDICFKCNIICCQDAKPPLTRQRQKIIEGYIKTRQLGITKLFLHGEYSFPAVNETGLCVFYDKKTRECLVHTVKPETCRAGPITFDINLKTGKIEWYLKTADICPLAGIMSNDSNLFKAHFKVAREEILRLVCELDGKALRAILKIEEPETFKIGEEDLPPEVLAKL